jgi:hypothetical protein
MQKVSFTTHAAQRMQQRLGINISQGQSVDITSNFVKTFGYIDTRNDLIEHWVNKDRRQPVVLAINAYTGFVVTVMTEGPIVDAAYRRLDTTH